MSRYLVQATYSAEGLRGLQKEKASGRQEVVRRAVQGLGGKLESMYYSLGEHDVILIVDVPDIIAGTALALAVSSSGLVRTRTTPLLTMEEADRALAKSVDYRPPRP